jgi:hypothetical protein
MDEEPGIASSMHAPDLFGDPSLALFGGFGSSFRVRAVAGPVSTEELP